MESVLYSVLDLMGSPRRLPSEEPAADSNSLRFMVDMSESTTSGMGLRETKKNVLAPGSQTKRSASSDVLPPEMPPLWCGPPCILECSLLQALSIDRLSLMDVLTLARLLSLSLFLSQPKLQLSVNTLALLSPLHSSPSRSVSHTLQQPFCILEEEDVRIKN